MKRFLAAGVAAATLFSAVPLMAKNSDDGFRLFGSLRAKADVQLGTADIACMQAAVRQRATAFVNAFNTYNQSITGALKVKADAEVQAWATVSVQERAIALAAAEKAFALSYNTASVTLIKEKNAARQAYNKAAVACRKDGTGSSGSSASGNPGTSSASSTSSNASVTCTNLSGKLTGAFTLTSPVNDEGRTLSLTGTGAVNGRSVEMSGSIRSLGFVAMGRANGDITIRQGTEGTVALHLEGPVQTGFASLPKSYSYTVRSSSGVFANVATSGKIGLQLKGDTNGSFHLELGGKCQK